MKPQDIDFRIWNRLREHYLEDHSFANEGYRSEINFCIARNGKVFAINEEGEVVDIIEDYELELFTGFTDKNGDKIYEGDRVRVTDINGDLVEIDQVIFNCNGFRLHKLQDSLDNMEDYNTFEVIGNIHENKNLLDNSIAQNEPSNTNKIRRMK